MDTVLVLLLFPLLGTGNGGLDDVIVLNADYGSG